MEKYSKAVLVLFVQSWYLFPYFVRFSYANGSDSCQYEIIHHAKLNPSFDSFLEASIIYNSTMAMEKCNLDELCKAITQNDEQVFRFYYTRRDKYSLEYNNSKASTVWLKICSQTDDKKLINPPHEINYYEPLEEEVSVTTTTILEQVRVKKTLLNDSVGMHATGKPSYSSSPYHGYKITISELPLPNDIVTEALITSWCTNEQCELSPRTYYHPVTERFFVVGFTDTEGQGHILLLNKSKKIYHRIEVTVEGHPAAVGGIYGFPDKSFAAALFVNADELLNRKMYLRLYRADHSIEWTTFLNSDISVPDRNVGDFRLSYGRGYFLVYFSVMGVYNFAEETNGDQMSYVTDRGELKTTSFVVPGQNFVKTGDNWGCSHSLGKLTAYHSTHNQFTVVCSSDLFPQGVSVGATTWGRVVFRAASDGIGRTSAQLGQLAESSSGFKLIFNAENVCTSSSCECCPAKGIGFITIFNEEDEISGKRAYEPVHWLTSTNGSSERDPVIARMILTQNPQEARERFLIGWHDRSTDEYKIGVVNMFGRFVKSPISVSNFATSGTMTCGGNCIMWGNRDDSFKTLPNGYVGWIYAPPNSKSLWLYAVGAEEIGLKTWSLWSVWSRCSRSCGGGIATRRRSCLSTFCGIPTEIDLQQCSTQNCTIPFVCSFERTDGYSLKGDLFIDGVRQFAFSESFAKEKCKQFKNLCKGVSRSLSGSSYFYFLKTSVELVSDSQSQSITMTCLDSPGWSRWSTWTACSASCGGGSFARSRFCDGEKPGSEVCLGESERTESCNTGECATWSTWTEWSHCSSSCGDGLHNRSRVCKGDYPKHCADLTGPSKQEKACSLGDCPKWGLWISWTACTVTCGGGMQERTRVCSGDFKCPIENGVGDTEGRQCTVGVCPYWSDWDSWSTCGASCGKSVRERLRHCLGDFSSEVGCQLPGDQEEVETCNLGECPYWGAWKPWNACSVSCGMSTRKRTRDCLGDFPAVFCSMGYAVETEGCNLGECAYLGTWQAWGKCSRTCGEGTQTRMRECLGDFPCPENSLISINKACNVGRCPSWSIWGSWGPCTVTCGSGGSRTRFRQCLGDFPHLCSKKEFTESSSCEALSDCPRWSIWSPWSVCSVSCDIGISLRTRSCTAEVLETCNFGAEDENADTMQDRNVTTKQDVFGDFIQTESQDCNNGRCSYWLDWSTWGACSTSCDEGTRSRTRECFGDFSYVCFTSGKAIKTESCTYGKCGAWGDWMPWGECSATCGSGIWTRSRECLSGVSDTCVGSASETSTCDVNDCVEVCESHPCQHMGNCRTNKYLNKQYHCTCPDGWMGKHCDFPGPDLVCGTDNIMLTFERKVVEEEGLITKDPSLVRLTSPDSVECTAMFDHFNTTEYYLIIAPSPIDTSCGSTMEITPTSFRIRNKVIWQIEDIGIRSTVVLIDFTCIYMRNATALSENSSLGTLSVESFKRQVEMATSSGLFDVDISLYRDSSYEREIFVRGFTSLVSIAEGEVVFVAVDLHSKDLLPSGDAALVMDTCFVTSSKNNREPLVYLIQESCPSSLLVTVISNGDSRSGKFSVRVFGWIGNEISTENVFIHCTVSVCNSDKDDCVPQCNSVSRKKRSFNKEKHVYSALPKKTVQMARLESSQEMKENTKQVIATSHNGHPYTSITQTVPSTVTGNAKINMSHVGTRLNSEKMVSVGPLHIVLRTRSRPTREVKHDMMSLSFAHLNSSYQLYLTIVLAALLSGSFSFAVIFIIESYQRFYIS